MTPLRAFLSYYVRSALPFVSGLVFGVFLFRFDLPLVWEVLAGMVLVVAGPFALQMVLVLLVEALRGIPEEEGERPRRRSTSLRADAPAGLPSLRPPRRPR